MFGLSPDCLYYLRRVEAALFDRFANIPPRRSYAAWSSSDPDPPQELAAAGALRPASTSRSRYGDFLPMRAALDLISRPAVFPVEPFHGRVELPPERTAGSLAFSRSTIGT